MNVHHLELFYYVAKHRGIMPAVRRMPYGIQQPAISKQMVLLEEFLGVTLFTRRPFQLTPAGEKLFNYIQPFFGNLDAMTAELQGATRSLRIGASLIILRDHLPELVQSLRKKFTDLKVTLREGHQPELEDMLLKDEIDLAITVFEQKSAPGIQAVPLLELPLVLLVEKNSRIKKAEDLWSLDKINEPLISLPGFELICKNFQQGLAELAVDWFPSIEVSSLELIEKYVAGELGIGLSLAIPKVEFSPKIRAIPLPSFKPILLGALQTSKMTPLLQAFLDEVQSKARSLVAK